MEEFSKMGATKKLRKLMIDKGVKQADVAQATGRTPGTLSNLMSRDSMTYATVEDICRVLGCEIVFRDVISGKIYD